MRGRFCRLLVFLSVFLSVVMGAPEMYAEEKTDENGLTSDAAEEFLMSEFDFREIEDRLQTMFPGEKITFSEVAEAFMSGDFESTAEAFADFLRDKLFYEFRYNRQSLIYVLLVSLTAAVFSNFAGAFQSRQISELSFYVMYMLLMTLCLSSFQTAAAGLEENLGHLLEFMRVLCPSFFLAVAFASGSATSLLFYNLILLLIYVVELVIVRLLLPVIHIYIMVRVLGNLTGEDYLSELAELLKKAVVWVLKTMLACVIGVNVVQGLLAPAIDSLKRSTLTRTAEALPLVGNLMGGTAEIFFGTAVLIKNGIGMAGAVAAAAMCAVPVIEILLMAFMYKLAAALVQPVSDRRITACISGVSEGYELMAKVIITTGLLFLLTIAVVAVSTS